MELGKICINNDHTCFFFIAFTFVGSLGLCLNTPTYGLVFKQLPKDLANVNA